jgi:proteasome accessory factor B
MVDRLERLTDLVLVLLRDDRPKPLREIAAEVPGYPAEGEARRQAFERDKRTLRDGGVDVSAVPIEGREQVGYLIRPEDFYLPDLDLAPDEQAALNLAVAGVQPFADLTALPALPVLYDAVRRRVTVTFDYRGDARHVAPALLRFRGGWWYVVGFDLDKEASRTFRVDRMEGQPSVGPPGSAVVPDDFDPEAALPEEPWRMGGEEEVVGVDVLVDAGLAPLVVAEVGEATVHSRRDDGAVVVRLEVTNVAALRSWVLELGEHAEVLAPDGVRAGMISWLEATAAGSREAVD